MLYDITSHVKKRRLIRQASNFHEEVIVYDYVNCVLSDYLASIGLDKKVNDILQRAGASCYMLNKTWQTAHPLIYGQFDKSSEYEAFSLFNGTIVFVADIPSMSAIARLRLYE